MELVNIGYGNLISARRLIAVVSPDSAPIKRMITEARERSMLIDGSKNSTSAPWLEKLSPRFGLEPAELTEDEEDG